MVVVDGSKDFGTLETSSGGKRLALISYIPHKNIQVPATNSVVGEIASSQYPARSAVDTYSSVIGICVQGAGQSAGSVFIYDPDIQTNEAAKTYFQSHPLTIFYRSVNYTPEADIAVALEKRVNGYAVFDGEEGIKKSVGNTYQKKKEKIDDALAKSSGSSDISSHYRFANNAVAADFPMDHFTWGVTSDKIFVIKQELTEEMRSYLSSQYSAGTPVQLVYELASAATYAHPIQSESLPAYYGTENFVTALAGEPVTGKWLTFTNDGTQLNFKGGGGVGVSKLAATTAVPADVVQGKTFYSKDKTLKTGTIVDRPGLNDAVSVGNDGSYIYYRINQGAYRTNQPTGYPEIRASNDSVISNIPGGNNGGWSGTYSGSNVTIPKGYHNGSGSVGVAGGNRGNWGATINPGGSVTIPQGYHAGGGVVRAGGGGSWPLRHMGFDGNNQLGTYTVGAPDGEGTYVWVFEGIVSWGNATSGLEFHFFENNFGPVYGERNSHITSGKNHFTSSTTVQVRYWGGFADLWYIRIA